MHGPRLSSQGDRGSCILHINIDWGARPLNTADAPEPGWTCERPFCFPPAHPRASPGESRPGRRGARPPGFPRKATWGSCTFCWSESGKRLVVPAGHTMWCALHSADANTEQGAGRPLGGGDVVVVEPVALHVRHLYRGEAGAGKHLEGELLTPCCPEPHAPLGQGDGHAVQA